MLREERMTKITERLKTKYLEHVSKFSDTTVMGNVSLSIPAILAPFQFHYSDLLRYAGSVSDEMEELYHRKVLMYKTGQSELSVIDINSSELKRMIESSEDYRVLKRDYEECVADMKLVEEMIGTIKNFSFNINNSLKFKELVGGAAV